jgi:hypothetical protein
VFNDIKGKLSKSAIALIMKGFLRIISEEEYYMKYRKT